MGEVVELGRGSPEAGTPVEVRHERRVRRHTHHYRLCEADLTRRVVIPENTEVGAPQAGSPARLGYVASSTRPAVRAPRSSTPRMPSTFATATQGSQRRLRPRPRGIARHQCSCCQPGPCKSGDHVRSCPGPIVDGRHEPARGGPDGGSAFAQCYERGQATASSTFPASCWPGSPRASTRRPTARP